MADLKWLFLSRAAALLPNGIPQGAGNLAQPAPQTAPYTRGGVARSLWVATTGNLSAATDITPTAGAIVPCVVSYHIENQTALDALRATNAALAAKTDRFWNVAVVGAANNNLYIDFLENNRGTEAIEGVINNGADTIASLIITAMPNPPALGLLAGFANNSITPASSDLALGSAAARWRSIFAVEYKGEGGTLVMPTGSNYWKLPTGGGADAANAMVLGKPVVDEGLPSILGLDGYPAVANYPLRGGAHGPAANIIHYSANGDAFTLVFCSHAAAAALFGANFPTAAAIDAAGGRMAPADNTLRITGHDESNQSINVTGAVVSAAGAAAASAIMVSGGLAASLALGTDDQTGVGFYRALRSATFALAAGAPLVVAGNVAAEAGLFASLRLRGREQPGASVVSAAPGANDDIDAGFVVGSRAIKTDGTAEWICTANTAGAAVWVQVRGAGADEIWTGSETSGTHNLISGKGFSDYSLLLFVMDTGSYNYGYTTKTLPAALFPTFPVATEQTESANDRVIVSWVSNTSFSVANNDGGEGIRKIYGIRL